MFAGVAPRYDLLNHLLSGALDMVWRRRAAAALGLGAGARVLDLCCGTGDQAAAIARRGAGGGGGRLLPADARPGAAEVRPARRAARGRARWRPTPSPCRFRRRCFDGATVSFGLRNVADLDRGLGELARALRPGGRLVVLEFALPANRALRGLYLIYFRRVLPWIGRLLSPRGSAYRYLPASVMEFPQRRGFLERMAAAGFAEPAWRDLAGGTVCLYSGTRA